MTLTIGYVCTNYNNAALSIEACKSLAAHSEGRALTVIVDNNSGAEEQQKLSAFGDERPDCDVILCSENLGYFGGLNLGINHLRQTQPNIKWIIAGNNDIAFESDFCTNLEVLQSEGTQYAVICPDIVTLDGVHQNPHMLGPVSNLRQRFYDLYYSNYHLGMTVKYLADLLGRFSKRTDANNHNSSQEIYAGHGACYVLTPRFFAQFDQLWAPSFLYYEELFLTRQLEAIGQKPYYMHTLQIAHKTRGTMSQMPKKIPWTYSRKAHLLFKELANSPVPVSPKPLESQP